MQKYVSREAFINELNKTAELFIKEFDDVAENEKSILLDGVDRTPQEMIAYQLGWMGLIRKWEKDELAGKKVITPSQDYKWNQLGKLYQHFYSKYYNYTLEELKEMYSNDVRSLVLWLENFEDKDLFEPGGRKWSQSTPANWPVWKWVHINTVAPFKSFRSKIRKWKKLNKVTRNLK